MVTFQTVTEKKEVEDRSGVKELYIKLCEQQKSMKVPILSAKKMNTSKHTVLIPQNQMYFLDSRDFFFK